MKRLQVPDTIFVLFGVTGDLARREIIPALFSLHLKGRLPQRFYLLGVGRSDYTDESITEYFRKAMETVGTKPERGQWEQFAASIGYQQGDAADPKMYPELKKRLGRIQKEWGTEPGHAFYMATPPSLFEPITTNLGNAGMASGHEQCRIVVEKPLGHDLESSRKINATLLKFFRESQIYRIDHFLGKETVQNILALRFANPIFEPIWNRRYVDHVAITVAETLGVEKRGGYYEKAGALRDMIQNHLLQLLTLVAMEAPVAFEDEEIRSKKLDVLRSLRPIPKELVSLHATRGQYADGWLRGERVPAYRSEPGIDPGSQTETYAAVKLFLDDWRWQGVPFYLRTGKRLAADLSEISIRFRDVPHRAFPPLVGINAEPVRLVIQIQPDPGIVLKFTAKEPGFELRLRPVDMRFCYRDTFTTEAPQAYETLLWDLMRGDATQFMRADQVETAWEILQPILEVWEETPAVNFPDYLAGSWGPESAEVLVARGGHNWLTPTLAGQRGA